MKVLMVDDSPTYVEIARRCLSDAGHELIANEWSGLACAIRQHHPDALILDINMPGLEGDRIGMTIRRYYDVPILFLSSEPVERLEAACACVSRSCFLHKLDPIETELVPKLLELSSPARVVA